MTRDERVAVGTAALKHETPAAHWASLAFLAWIGMGIFLYRLSPWGMCALPVVHLVLWRIMFPEDHLRRIWNIQIIIRYDTTGARARQSPLRAAPNSSTFVHGLVWAPALALWLAGDAWRNRCSLYDSVLADLRLPEFPKHFTGLRLLPENTAMDLGSRSVVGSAHAALQERAHRTEAQDLQLFILHRMVPEAILVSGERRHVLVGKDGEILGIERITQG